MLPDKDDRYRSESMDPRGDDIASSQKNSNVDLHLAIEVWTILATTLPASSHSNPLMQYGAAENTKDGRNVTTTAEMKCCDLEKQLSRLASWPRLLDVFRNSNIRIAGQQSTDSARSFRVYQR